MIGISLGMMTPEMVVGYDEQSGNAIPPGSEAEEVRDDVDVLLSEGEYVLPADVVSALGNGSSNAGADMLDKFMTDVREKSMGRERQINQIG